MALKIFWTKRAFKKFTGILAYLEEEYGEGSTTAFAIKVHTLVDNLQDFPELGAIQNIEHQIRGFVIVKQVTIFYKVYQDHISILNLFDNRKHPNKKFKG